MQIVTCPVCRQSEVIDNDNARGKSWTCSKCGAVAADAPQVVIRFGNHFINSDRLTVRSYPGAGATTDAAEARQYPFDKAEKFRLAMLKANKVVELFTPHSALAIKAEDEERQAKSAYFYAFEAEIMRLCEAMGKPLGSHWTYYIRGNGCSTYHYYDSVYRGQGIDPKAAAAKFVAEIPPRPAVKRA